MKIPRACSSPDQTVNTQLCLYTRVYVLHRHMHRYTNYPSISHTGIFYFYLPPTMHTWQCQASSSPWSSVSQTRIRLHNSWILVLLVYWYLVRPMAPLQGIQLYCSIPIIVPVCMSLSRIISLLDTGEYKWMIPVMGAHKYYPFIFHRPSHTVSMKQAHGTRDPSHAWYTHYYLREKGPTFPDLQ